MSNKTRRDLQARTPKLTAERTIDRDQDLTNCVRQAAAVFNTALKNATAAGLEVDSITDDESLRLPAVAIRLGEIVRRYK